LVRIPLFQEKYQQLPDALPMFLIPYRQDVYASNTWEL